MLIPNLVLSTTYYECVVKKYIKLKLSKYSYLLVQLDCVIFPIISAIRAKLVVLENILKSTITTTSAQEDTSNESHVISAVTLYVVRRECGERRGRNIYNKVHLKVQINKQRSV